MCVPEHLRMPIITAQRVTLRYGSLGCRRIRVKNARICHSLWLTFPAHPTILAPTPHTGALQAFCTGAHSDRKAPMQESCKLLGFTPAVRTPFAGGTV